MSQKQGGDLDLRFTDLAEHPNDLESFPNTDDFIGLEFMLNLGIINIPQVILIATAQWGP